MNALWVKNIIRCIILVALQVLILKRINFGWESFNYFSFIVFPLAIILLPIRTPKLLLLIIGFISGLLVDIFYDSPGVHASAAVFVSYIRPYILQILEPRIGYPTQMVGPTRKRFGSNWFFTYAGMVLGIYLLVYFIAEVFTYIYTWQIILKTICSFIVSFLCIVIYFFLINPED